MTRYDYYPSLIKHGEAAEWWNRLTTIQKNIYKDKYGPTGDILNIYENEISNNPIAKENIKKIRSLTHHGWSVMQENPLTLYKTDIDGKIIGTITGEVIDWIISLLDEIKDYELWQMDNDPNEYCDE